MATVEVKCANKQCGAKFTARVADRNRGWGKYCCKSCKAIVQTQKHGGRHRRKSDDCEWLGVGEIAGQE